MNIFDADTEAFGHNTDDLIDLRFGDPVFMQKYWQNLNFDDYVAHGNRIIPLHNISSNNHMGYIHTTANEDLQQTIRNIHRQVGNANPAGKFIVVGVGASQLLSAAIYALSNDSTVDVFARPPFFSRFQHFTAFSGISDARFHMTNPDKDFVEIVTLPNNPDGKIDNKGFCHRKIYDLCYNWPNYTDVVKYDEEIMIFSLAKATGHASTRVGWALVHNQKIADRMRHFVEMSTSGVSYNALKIANNILKSQINPRDPKFTCFHHGRARLDRRWGHIKDLTKDKPFVVLNDQGMFAWCRMKEDTDPVEFFKSKYDALVVNGKYFGAGDDQHFRINIGTHSDPLSKFLTKLKNS